MYGVLMGGVTGLGYKSPTMISMVTGKLTTCTTSHDMSRSVSWAARAYEPSCEPVPVGTRMVSPLRTIGSWKSAMRSCSHPEDVSISWSWSAKVDCSQSISSALDLDVR